MNSKEMRELSFRTAQKYLNLARYWRAEMIGADNDDQARSSTKIMNEYIIRYKTVIYFMRDLELISPYKCEEMENEMYEELYEII